ncbi:MAG: MATE family efflux transporter [Lachnospiraceae bacterium]|nr:MATE family efflux transporter [Lachnospiraceae bacterium]
MLYVAVPIMIQNLITNVVGMLDNIMVGQIGTNQMTGVSIINQFIFVFNLCIFGAVSGAGIFTAQYYGQGNNKGIRDTMRFKLIIGLVVCGIAFLVLFFGGENLMQLFLHEDGVGNSAETLRYGKAYLTVMFFEMLPFALSQIYAGTLRETGETILPMKAGMIAVAVNLVLNYILIFGKFGAPALGVMGAAAATVVSRFTELFIIVIYTHKHSDRFPYVVGLYESMKIPPALIHAIILKGAPLLLNEALWSAGQTVMVQSYSLRGLSVVAAFNISNTLANVFNVAFIAMGEAIAIILGQELGAGKPDVKEDSYKMTFFAVTICIVMGALMFLAAPIFPQIYETEDSVKELAVRFIMISACFMPIYAYENSAYFTLRSGGKTVITFIFDSAFVWCVSIPVAYVVTRFTDFNIVTCVIIVNLFEFIKVAAGFFLVKRGAWIQDLTKLTAQK